MANGNRVGNKTNKDFFPCYTGVVGDVAVRLWINTSWWPFALYDAHPKYTNCDEIQTSASLALSLCLTRSFVYLLIHFSVVAQILLYILYILSFQCVCVRYHSLGSLCWLSQTSLIFIQSFSFSLSSFLFVRLFYAYNLLKLFFLSTTFKFY